jgi:hypothetical protein
MWRIWLPPMYLLYAMGATMVVLILALFYIPHLILFEDLPEQWRKSKKRAEEKKEEGD